MSSVTARVSPYTRKSETEEIERELQMRNNSQRCDAVGFEDYGRGPRAKGHGWLLEGEKK